MESLQGVSKRVESSVRVALVSVGGSPTPILFTLRRHRPAHVWYFCSRGSRDFADGIHAQLEWHPDRDVIEVEHFEQLGPCYRELRRQLPGLLTKWKIDRKEVLVDYTGGTKTMSAALVLASTELFDQFSYVGGEQREKAGLGITIEGKERILYQSNPWSDLAVREIERARDLWASCQFDPAAETLSGVAARVSRPLLFQSIAALAKALAARHRLEFRAGLKLLGSLKGTPTDPGKIPMLYDGHPADGLLSLIQQTYEICVQCSKDAANETLLRELLDNALRTARQARFEDAAARLYRAMEMRGQLWLAQSSGGIFQNGRMKPNAVLPPALTALDFCKPDERGEVRLSLEQIFHALGKLGHEQAKKIVVDLNLERKSRWRQATEKRNTSILAHGVNPIGEEGFELMKQLSSEFLGFDLQKESYPIPDLNPLWF